MLKSSKAVKPSKPKFEWDLVSIEDPSSKNFVVLSCVWKSKILKSKHLSLFSQELFQKVTDLCKKYNPETSKPGVLLLDFSSIAVGNPELSSKAIDEMAKIEDKNQFSLNIVVTKSVYLPVLKSILESHKSNVETLSCSSTEDAMKLIEKKMFKS